MTPSPNPSPDRPFPTLKRRDRPKSARLAMLVAYDGAGFRGFQRQPAQRTVEGEIVRALVELGLTGGLSFASRTDAGVHAEGQVVAFRAPAGSAAGPLEALLVAQLPPDVRLRTLQAAPAKFHPRWSATGKRYRYRLTESPRPRSWDVGVLDRARLEEALEALRQAPRLDGFTAAGAPDKPAPPLERLTLVAHGGAFELVFEGPAFRRYAIRHMVGAAVACARGGLSPGQLEALALARPPYVGPRAPADGLVLEEVHYPAALDPFARTDALDE